MACATTLKAKLTHKRNISGLKPYQPGQSGNPGGKTSAQRKAEVEAAEKAALIRDKLLEAVLRDMAVNPETEKMLAHLKADVLRLVTDTLDRAHGKPAQAVDHTSSDGSMSPSEIIIRAADANRHD